ncbi:hypothetical protein BKE38_02910 [Pseudoroseomonas deserti]|uniref:DUF1963 domain-containing protein n=1 Tax=Teichococcus deserti TaxID=1817963 RepID=A0A1V2H7B2_9PROT|nr:DUF1963 domain-containing protein [Pseudoroseomonas deserti]ONG58296.1 hypothetical protein BKE38_02910 [Pseudoroseomonas deserti]
MIAFRDEAQLRAAIAEAGLEAMAGQLLATARPAQLFLRRQRRDDDLPVGASKMGGLPDWPPGRPWPSRLARPDAAAWEDSVRRQRARLDAFLDSRGLAREPRRAAHDALLIESFSRPFPLAFRAQLDLQALSELPGFDADLPRHGLLSIFEDLTGDGSGHETRLIWHDGPIAALERRAVPAEIIALSDALEPAMPWASMDQAELLEPQAALTLPHRWLTASGWRDERLFQLLRQPSQQLVLQGEPGPGDGQVGWFADRLGGWPDPIQSDPEAELPEAAPGFAPGDDRIRHVFSWGGEYYGGTRLPNSEIGGDGTTHVMLPREALLARRFGAARGVYQCD